jgi:Helicase subunit of the DNA excision repair complex
VNLFGDTVENIEEFDPLTGHKQDDSNSSRSTPTRTT